MARASRSPAPAGSCACSSPARPPRARGSRAAGVPAPVLRPPPGAAYPLRPGGEHGRPDRAAGRRARSGRGAWAARDGRARVGQVEPRIQYAKTADDVNIAYWTLGEGAPLVDMVWPFSHI